MMAGNGGELAPSDGTSRRISCMGSRQLSWAARRGAEGWIDRQGGSTAQSQTSSGDAPRVVDMVKAKVAGRL